MATAIFKKTDVLPYEIDAQEYKTFFLSLVSVTNPKHISKGIYLGNPTSFSGIYWSLRKPSLCSRPLIG